MRHGSPQERAVREADEENAKRWTPDVIAQLTADGFFPPIEIDLCPGPGCDEVLRDNTYSRLDGGSEGGTRFGRGRGRRRESCSLECRLATLQFAQSLRQRRHRDFFARTLALMQRVDPGAAIEDDADHTAFAAWSTELAALCALERGVRPEAE